MNDKTAATGPISAASARRLVGAVFLFVGLMAALVTGDIPRASADVTGFRNPSAQAAATGGDGNGFETNAADAFTDANGEAEDRDSGTSTTLSCTNAGKDRHTFYNYGFPIPAGSSVSGIEVRVDVQLDNATGFICAELSPDGGATWTAPQQTANLTTAFALYTMGGSTNTWGRSWTASEFSDTNFRIRLTSVANNTASRFRLDWVSAQVHYTAAAPDTIGPVTSNVVATGGTSGQVDLSAEISDTATGNSPVAGAEYFVDILGANGAGTAMIPSDGSFNSPSEAVSASVDMSTQAPGDHILYVRGRDGAGNWGAAASLTVTVTTGGGTAVQALITLIAGTLSVDTYPITFPPVNLDGLDQTVDTSPVAWRALDARGTGAGWNITLTSGDFSATGGTIPVANFKVQQQQSRITTNSGNTPPQTQVSSYQALSSSIPLKLISASAGAGMGSYDFTPDFRLTVPASTTPGEYRASLVVSVNSGP